MKISIFARLHAFAGREGDVERAAREFIAATREEPGCLDIHLYRSTQDKRLFYIHSQCLDEAAFERHLEMPHTSKFIERVSTLIDHPLEPVRTTMLV